MDPLGSEVLENKPETEGEHRTRVVKRAEEALHVRQRATRNGCHAGEAFGVHVTSVLKEGS